MRTEEAVMDNRVEAPAPALPDTTSPEMSWMNATTNGSSSAEPVSPYALEMDAVTKWYGAGHEAVNALREVTVGLVRGSVTAVIGLPGSGKSTLIACATGSETPTTGTVCTHDRVTMPDPRTWGTLAPASATHPELLVADDLESAEDLCAAIGYQDSRTMLVTTSDPAVAAAADVTLFLVGGRLVDAMCGMPAEHIAEHLARLTS